VVVGDHLSNTGFESIDTKHQIDNCSTDGNLTPVINHAMEEKVFVGSIKSNKYHYPGCQRAKKILSENEI